MLSASTQLVLLSAPVGPGTSEMVFLALVGDVHSMDKIDECALRNSLLAKYVRDHFRGILVGDLHFI